jgi:threonine aldolase
VEDRANARRLADAIRSIPKLTLDQTSVDSNLVFFDCAETGFTAAELSKALVPQGVQIGAMGRYRMRAVTHLDVDAAGVDAAGDALRELLAG